MGNSYTKSVADCFDLNCVILRPVDNGLIIPNAEPFLLPHENQKMWTFYNCIIREDFVVGNTSIPIVLYQCEINGKVLSTSYNTLYIDSNTYATIDNDRFGGLWKSIKIFSPIIYNNVEQLDNLLTDENLVDILNTTNV